MTTKSTAVIESKTTSPAEFRPALLRFLWRSRYVGSAAVVGISALAGLVLSLQMPRGPANATQTLIVMAVCLVTGLFAGIMLPSRWAMLLAPLAHIAGYELGRIGAVGATIGAIHLEMTYGILAFILGRGFYAIVGLLPMAYGAGLSLRLSRQSARIQSPGSRPARSAGSIAGWVFTALIGIALLTLAVLIVQPATTPPILGKDGNPLPGSIAELTRVRLGGHDQAVMIRGENVDNPVLLYLSGGPGQTDLAYTRVLLQDLEKDFTIVGWDQRGSGKSYAALEPVATLTLDQMINDTNELANYLRDRFDEQKIYLLGESWGATLGVLAVQRQPDLYYAYIGSGQMVSQRETDRMLYQDVLDLAAQKGDQALTNKMLSYGPPPYATMWPSTVVMEQYDQLYKPYTPSQAYMDRGQASGLIAWGINGSEYDLVEKVNVLRAALDMFSVMYPQLQGLDFRKDVPSLPIPVYILDGAAELTSRRVLALEWYEQLQAPIKHIYTFENSAHSTAFEQFEAFHEIMKETVLPDTYPAQ